MQMKRIQKEKKKTKEKKKKKEKKKNQGEKKEEKKKVEEDDSAKLSPLELVASLFHAIDEDNDNFISKEEIIVAFLPGVNGNQTAKNLIAEIMKRTEEGSNDADIGQDIRCLGLLLHPSRYRLAFEKIDTDTSGYVSKDELLRFCSEQEGWKHIDTVTTIEDGERNYTLTDLRAGHGKYL